MALAGGAGGAERGTQAANNGKERKKAPRPPPGISGTVANLVISPDWFAAKEANQRDRFWWSPGKQFADSALVLVCPAGSRA